MPISRMRRKHGSLSIVLLLSSALSGCDQIIDSIIDCIDDDQPELRGELPSPILNQVYDEGISVSIRNEPYDNRFTYRFEFSGNLPQGIQRTSSNRSFRLMGTPIEVGEYNFRISVTVEEDTVLNPGETEGLCSTSDTEDFQWFVQSM